MKAHFFSATAAGAVVWLTCGGWRDWVTFALSTVLAMLAAGYVYSQLEKAGRVMDALGCLPPLHERLRYGADTLAIIDRRRAEEDDPHIGIAIERKIVDRELLDLEHASRHFPNHSGLVVRSKSKL
ncbi:MAG: hypothetical protein U0Q18_25480 [Bryobacteraceae bacterium]